MSIYFQSYLHVLKKNYMLVVIAAVLLILTYFIWAGVPFFIIGNIVADATSSGFVTLLSIALSGGFLFSLYFLPIHIKVAKRVASFEHRSVKKLFVQIQLVWIFICSAIFAISMSVIRMYL
ncbi:hypothetical protein ACFFJI_02400 [Allobacillus sp. GCM10007491]|uniref:Uncharacterized protein n=1 Tax=Allobacillus saliphilus TaxID=2912308 RepID=A0A941CXP4_9BACI|nr:hypothetical protein [Allobacillus saliphilus]MBR7554010.1 hypothetical protein [Allobacillus saliphilus]